jgi:hypothetical protein
MGTVRRAVLSMMVLAVVLGGCAAPRYTFVADSSAHTYFKVPSGWAKIGNSALATATGSAKQKSRAWAVGYDASRQPSAADVLSSVSTQPFAYATVGNISSTATNMLSYNTLRDFFLPVTAAARQTAAKAGTFPLTAFHLLDNSMLTPADGVHGVRVVFDYTYPGGHVVTFDQVALANADDTEVYVLLVHCLATCYRQDRSAINTVMTSFTVRSP